MIDCVRKTLKWEGLPGLYKARFYLMYIDCVVVGWRG